MPDITESLFKNRFPALILGGGGYPKKQLDRHILLISAARGLETGRTYSEIQINELLQGWSNLFGDNFGLDHVTLRRYLVDEKYFEREANGISYTVTAGKSTYSWDPAIAALDIEALVQEARTEREHRKQAFLRKR